PRLPRRRVRAPRADARGRRRVPPRAPVSLELRVAPPVHGVRRRACGLGGSLPDMPSLEHPPALAPSRPAVPAWRQWLTAAVDLVFPPFCPVCATRLGPGRRDPLCGACWE